MLKKSSQICRAFRWSAIVFAVISPARTASAGELTAARQSALVQKYCAVCHTDTSKNGGLSLQHYDASQPDPTLAAMLLSKLRNGAMGAARLGIPDKDTQNAWIAATTAQAASATQWNVIRGTAPVSKATILTASIVRAVPPRKPGEDSPLYRLTLACDIESREGEIQLTWSPAPQIDRTFSVSTDGMAPVPYKLEGKEVRMGNGTPGTSGLASARLQLKFPARTLAITGLFSGETVVFPFGDLDANAQHQMSACFASNAAE